MRNYTSFVEEFIELLAHLVDSLTTHSYVAKSQARYLKAHKTDSDQIECLILLDFAENYHYVVQDDVQGYHWNKQQYTLHPVVLYHKNEKNELQCIPICLCQMTWITIQMLYISRKEKPVII